MAKPSNDADTAGDTPAPGGKGRPTPTRKQREAQNVRPLVSNDRKAAAKEARAKMAVEREKARVGLAAGDERYLPQRDRGPQRKWIRDYVDARFSIGEILIPLMFVIIFMTLIDNQTVQFVGIIALWTFFAAAVADAFLLGWLIKRKLGTKYGPENVQKGSRWYGAMRGMQLRMLRLPKPQVKRGQFPA
ncbi:MAG TPA: DUF3043 domain-containing protein [Terrimesophilobacter sp.]|nr:DUF3043 domain-containing protein [Terrimesophilobacter sp.]